MRRPKLVKIDLKKCTSANGDKTIGFCDHPDINARKKYLARIGGNFFAGGFNRQWYGWSFNGWHNDLQLDKPGTNGSNWQDLWEIQRG